VHLLLFIPHAILIGHCRYAFEDAIKAFEATKKGVGEDGKAVIKAIISCPGVQPEDK
jgi:hypothetical protein